MTPLGEDALFEFLSNNLRIQVCTYDEYTGNMDGPLYRPVSTVRLVLCEQVISSAYL